MYTHLILDLVTPNEYKFCNLCSFFIVLLCLLRDNICNHTLLGNENERLACGLTTSGPQDNVSRALSDDEKQIAVNYGKFLQLTKSS
jgi:hypothetical protein